jgi:hypothetical protein
MLLAHRRCSRSDNSMDLFVVPTIGFDLLYAYIIVRLDRRELVWISVTTHPTAEWVARQITEAFPWNEAPRYMIRGRNRIYGSVVARRLRAMGIRDKPPAPASPWQNGFAERLIGSIRRESVDHMIVLGEAHLRRILRSLRQSIARYSAPVSFVHAPSLADFTTTTPVLKFSAHTRRSTVRVALSWLNIFPKDAPSVFDGAQDSLLVGIIHNGTQLHRTGIQAGAGRIVPGDHRRRQGSFRPELTCIPSPQGAPFRHHRPRTPRPSSVSESVALPPKKGEALCQNLNSHLVRNSRPSSARVVRTARRA